MRQNQQTDDLLQQGLLIVVFASAGLAFLTPLIVTFSTIFPFIVGKAVYSHILIEIAFGAWLLLAWKNPDYRLHRSRVIQAFAIYLAVALLAGLFGVSVTRSLWSTYERMMGVVDLAHWLALAVVLASTLRTAGNWRILLNVNLGVSLFMALLGFAQLYGWRIPPFDFFEQQARLDITLGNSTYVGAYMLINVLIAIGFLAHSALKRREPEPPPVRGRRRRRRAERRPPPSQDDYGIWVWRLFWFATASLNLWVMIYSGTRGVVAGGVAALLALGVCYVLIGRLRPLRAAAAVCVVVALLGGVTFLAVRDTDAFQPIAESNVMIRRLADANLEDTSLQGRINSVAAGLRAFLDRPILGYGPENYHVAFGKYVAASNPSFEKFDQAHSKPVEELATKGALGFVSYMAIWALMFWTVVRRARREDAGDQAFTLLIGAALVGYLAQSLFLFDTATMLLQFVMLVAFVANLERPPVSEQPQPASRRGRSRTTNVPVRAGALARLARRMDGVPALAADARFLYASIVVAALVVAAILFVNIQAWSAAQIYRDVRVAADMSLEERIDGLRESVTIFPGLGNYPRRDLFGYVRAELPGLDQERGEAVLLTTQEVAEEAMDVEPDNWHMVVGLGMMYQAAASQDDQYLALARAFTDQATELAPGRWEVYQLRARQLFFEGEPAAGVELLNEFFDVNPRAVAILGGLRDQLVSVSRQ